MHSIEQKRKDQLDQGDYDKMLRDGLIRFLKARYKLLGAVSHQFESLPILQHVICFLFTVP